MTTLSDNSTSHCLVQHMWPGQRDHKARMQSSYILWGLPMKATWTGWYPQGHLPTTKTSLRLTIITQVFHALVFFFFLIFRTGISKAYQIPVLAPEKGKQGGQEISWEFVSWEFPGTSSFQLMENSTHPHTHHLPTTVQHTAVQAKPPNGISDNWIQEIPECSSGGWVMWITSPRLSDWMNYLFYFLLCLKLKNWVAIHQQSITYAHGVVWTSWFSFEEKCPSPPFKNTMTWFKLDT